MKNTVFPISQLAGSHCRQSLGNAGMFNRLNCSRRRCWRRSLMGGILATGMGLLSQPALGQLPERAPSGLLERALEGVSDPLPDISPGSSQTEASQASLESGVASDILQQAAARATQAELLAQTARSAEDWDQVMKQWIEAIWMLQSIPPQSPSRLIAQRQLRSYLEQLAAAQRRAEQGSPVSSGPSWGSELLDAQLAGYFSYLATFGTPDILVVGSSRALQGIDPTVMQQQLARQGYPDIEIYNFSVNGATAQVVDFVLAELLPAPLPPVIIWGDGSRAFNDGRRDRTWESLIASPGYRSLMDERAGERVGEAAPRLAQEMGTAALTLDALGFSAVSDEFDPYTYYQQFPKVNGRYDGAYSPFSLGGEQAIALGEAAAFIRAQNAQLIFVNLPLSDSYLDDFRLYHEAEFQRFIQTQSTAQSFAVVDFLRLWSQHSELFADPSHINQQGAAVIASQLAQHPILLTALQRSGLGVAQPAPSEK